MHTYGTCQRQCQDEAIPTCCAFLPLQVMTALVQLYRRYVFRLDPVHHPGSPAGLQRRLVSAATLNEEGGVWVTARMRNV